MAQHKLQQLVSQNVADVSHKGALLNDICSSPASHIRLCGPDRRWTTCGRACVRACVCGDPQRAAAASVFVIV